MRKITKAVFCLAYDEYDYSQLLSEYAWKRLQLLREGKLSVPRPQTKKVKKS